ncbi:MAG: metal ABC transporter permease [Chloroflexia bacterium]
MIAWILEPLRYGFMQRGLIASLLVGVLCAVVGCYVVLRSMAFLGDALAHAILPGIAVAYLLKVDLLVGATIAALLVAVGIAAISQRGVIREDTAIGILFAAALSLGVALISRMKSYAVDLTHILFGHVLGVGVRDLWLIGLLGAAVLLMILLLFKEFLVVSFDPVLAATLRLPAGRLRLLLLVLLALTIVVSLQTVGVGLVAAMLVTPAATAHLLTHRLARMMGLAAGLGAFSAVAGLYLSYYGDIPSGPAVVLVATALFLLAFAFAPKHGFVWVRLHQWGRIGRGQRESAGPCDRSDAAR